MFYSDYEIIDQLIGMPGIVMCMRVEGSNVFFSLTDPNFAGINRMYSIDEVDQFGLRLILTNMYRDLKGMVDDA